MLGAGEQLRKVTITVEPPLDRSAKDVRKWDGVLHKSLGTHTMAAFTLFPKDGEVVSPSTAILVTIRRRKWENSDSSVSRRLVSTRSSLSMYVHSQPQKNLQVS
jgi:hypothetical protein